MFDEEQKDAESVYAWWACILIMRMMALIWLTGRIRVKTKTIHSEEDRMWMEKPNIIINPSGGGHPELDRIRSVHYHDLQITLFFLFIYIIWLKSTSPSDYSAIMIMRIFSICKITDAIIIIHFSQLPSFIVSCIETIYYSILFYICVALFWYHW